MGYRSDGKIVFYALDPKDHAAIKLWVDEHFPKTDFDYEEREVNKRKIMAFSFEGWKWYDTYPEIIAIENAIKAFCELFDHEDTVVRAAMERVRIGEEYEDIEIVRSNYSDCILTVNRSVEFFD